MCLPTVLWNGRCPLATASPTAQLASVGLSGTDLAWWIVGGVLGRLLRTGRVIGVARVGTLWFGGLDLSDAGFVLVPLIRHRPLRSAGRPGHGHRALRHRASSVLVLDNGSSHRAQASIDRLQHRWPKLRLIHLPLHVSWLNQMEISSPSCNVKSSHPTTSTPSSRRGPTARLPAVLRTDRHTVRMEVHQDDLNALLERIAADEDAALTPAG